MVHTYLFDLDGTLIDKRIYREIHGRVIAEIIKHLNLTNEEIFTRAKDANVSRNDDGTWDSGELCRALGLLDVYYEILNNHVVTSNVLCADVKDVLRQLKQNGKTIGVVSNSMRRTIHLYMRKYQLSQYIDFIFSIDDAECKKDSLDYWGKLIKQKNLVPERCIMIGDDVENDITIPKSFGFQTFFIENNNIKEIMKKSIYV
jgi:HAD superfamily hydrolase (TIGR01662 family)